MSDWETNRRKAEKDVGAAGWDALKKRDSVYKIARNLADALADKYGFGKESDNRYTLEEYASKFIPGEDISEDKMVKINQIFDNILSKEDAKSFKDALNNLKAQRDAAEAEYKPLADGQLTMQDFNRALGPIKKGLYRLGLSTGEVDEALDKITGILDAYLD